MHRGETVRNYKFISTVLITETKICFKVYFPVNFLLKIKMELSMTYDYHERNVYLIIPY